MTEPEIKRIVVACSAEGEIEHALRAAAALAVHWQVPLHGVFLRDENLLRLAELPFARTLSLSVPEPAKSLGRDDLETLLSALAARMRRALAAAAEEAGLDWSFAELRDVPSAASAVIEEGDMLVIEAGGQPVSGAWRPRSPWEAVATALGRSVLLRRAGPTARRRRVAIVPRAGADPARILAAASSMAGPRDNAVILHFGDDKLARGLAQRLAAEGLAAVKRQAVKDWADAWHRLQRLKPDLVILDTSALEEAELRSLIAETSCDLLLLG